MCVRACARVSFRPRRRERVFAHACARARALACACVRSRLRLRGAAGGPHFSGLFRPTMTFAGGISALLLLTRCLSCAFLPLFYCTSAVFFCYYIFYVSAVSAGPRSRRGCRSRTLRRAAATPPSPRRCCPPAPHPHPRTHPRVGARGPRRLPGPASVPGLLFFQVYVYLFASVKYFVRAEP